MKKLGVDVLPAIVGWMSNGEKHVLQTGISVKDLNSAVQELSALLNDFERKNKKATSSQAKKPETKSVDKQIHLLTTSNFDALCGETIPVCLIGVFKSPKAREKVESILSVVSKIILNMYTFWDFGWEHLMVQCHDSYLLLELLVRANKYEILDSLVKYELNNHHILSFMMYRICLKLHESHAIANLEPVSRISTWFCFYL